MLARCARNRLVWISIVSTLAACAAMADQTGDQGSVMISDPTGGLATQLGPYGLLGFLGYRGLALADKCLNMVERG